VRHQYTCNTYCTLPKLVNMLHVNRIPCQHADFHWRSLFQLCQEYFAPTLTIPMPSILDVKLQLVKTWIMGVLWSRYEQNAECMCLYNWLWCQCSGCSQRLLVTCCCRTWEAVCFKCLTVYIYQDGSWKHWQTLLWPLLPLACSSVGLYAC